MFARALVVIAVLSVVALGAAASRTISIDFAKYDETQWEPARPSKYKSAGKFVQKDGYVINDYPEGTSEADLFRAKDGVGVAMRVLKDVEVKNGRADLELAILDRAAPTIAFRVQVDENGAHKELYHACVYNHSSPARKRGGINLWKWVAIPPGEKGRPWVKLGYWNMTIPRDTKFKLAVVFRNGSIRLFYNDEEVGGVTDQLPHGPGKIGVLASEGGVKLYSFKFTPMR